MASSRHPSPRPRCLPHSGTRIPFPPSGLRPPALCTYSQGFRLSEVLCCCVAPVLLLSLLHSAAARVPAAFVQGRSCSRRFAIHTPPAGRFRQQNNELPAHSGLRPPFTTKKRIRSRTIVVMKAAAKLENDPPFLPNSMLSSNSESTQRLRSTERGGRAGRNSRQKYY